MPDDGLDEMIRDARAALGPTPDLPLPPTVLGSPPGDDSELNVAFARPEGGIEPVIDRPLAAATGVAVWDALGALKSLLDLVPSDPAGRTRLEQCVDVMRGHYEKDLFPNADPDRPDGGNVCPITYPRLEVNQTVDRVRQTVLGLLNSVEIEKGVRELLSRELRKPSPFLEPDDRGTIGGFIDPTGATMEKQRNDWKLNALAAFLDALRHQPFAAVRYAAGLLIRVSIPPDLLSVNTAENTVTFRGKPYTVSDPTCCFIDLLIAADGRLVSATQVAEELTLRGSWDGGEVRPDRLKHKLPAELKAAIITTPQGSRLDRDRLLSNA